MNKIRMQIWEREFELDIVYDCYAGEEILNNQQQAVQAFVKAEEAIRISLEKMKEYCLITNSEEIGSEKIENIFKYVVPKYLYVERSKENHIIAIMCNYKFDMDNGIAVVFENELFSRICKQDEIL